MCEDKVLLRNVNPDTSRDALDNFLELKASALPKSLINGEEEGTIFVMFDKNIDFDTFASACQTCQLEGSFLNPERVPVTNCVYVGNLNPDTTSDGLEMFFENARRSGGGDIQKVEMSDIDNSCLIFFKDFKVVDSVCNQRQLILDNSTLSVHPHYSCLGQASDGDGKTHVFEAPQSIEVQDTDKIKMYAFLYQHEKGEVDQTFEAINAWIDWPKRNDDVQFSVSPTLSKITKNVRKLAKTWNDDVLQAMFKIEKSLKVEKIQILKEIWNDDFKEKIRVDVTADSSSVQVSCDDQSCEVILIGYQAQVDQKARLIEESRCKAENDLERKKTMIREEMYIGIPKLVLLRDLDTLSTMSQDMPDLAVTSDTDRGNIVFDGQLTDIKSAKVNIYEILSKISNTKIEKQFSKAALQFLKNAAVHQYFESKMKEAGIRCSWEVFPSDSYIVLYSLTQPDIVKAADLIKAHVMEKSHQIDRISIALLSKDPWKKLCDDFATRFPGMFQIEVDMTKCLVQILTIAEHCGEILETIDDFIARNSIIEESIKLDPGVSKYLKQYKRDDIDIIENRSTLGNVKISLSNKEMVICGSRDALNLTKPLVEDIASKVKCRCFPLDKPGIQEILLSAAGEACRRDIESRRTCIIEVLTTGNIESTRSSHDGTVMDSQPELIATGTTRSRAVIKTFQGDITLLNVDVIVNAANSSMDRVGGLARFIVTKGGQNIQDECTEYIKRKGNLQDGNIYCSKPGNLKCKMIAHANSPNWQGGNQREQEDLDGVVWKSLEECDRNGYTSIAIPALGTGVFQFPENKATHVIIETILEFLEEEIHTSVNEIYLCDINPTAASCFAEELKRRLGEACVVDHKKPVQDQWTCIIQKENKDVSGKRRNLNVQIVKGQISKATTDVIVNTTSCDLHLTNGAVSNAILQAAGQSIQDECHVGYPNGIQHGNVATTTGGHLKCKLIFHGALQSFKTDKAFQQFQDFMRRCLQMADDEMMTSISFPALGTNNLSYPHDIVAAEMFKIVYEFNPTTLNEVQFVIYEKDARSLKAFRDEETKWSSASGHSSVPSQSDSDMMRRQNRTFTKNTGSLKHSKGRGMKSSDMSFRYKTDEMSSVSSISFVIYGEVECYRDAAYRDLELFYEKEIIEYVYEDPIIMDFSDSQRTKLDELKDSLGVEVIIEKRPPRIRLFGLPVNVKKASNEIDHMIMDIQRSRLTNEREKTTAKCVEWSVITECDGGRTFLPYSEVLNHKIENDYQQQRPKTTFCDDEGTCYEIDFSAMEEYPVDDQNDRAAVLRKDKLQPTKYAHLQLPPTWTPMTDQDPIIVVPIQASDAEYKDVLKDLNASIGNINHTIVKIERIQNQTLYHQYMTKKVKMDRSCSGQSERMLWHGTTESAVDSINMHGFNRSFFPKNATAYGNGIYFACNSNYSARNTYSPINTAGQKKMYRCRVLAGDFTKGKQGIHVPPAKKGHILYDSVVDDTKNPNMFIIFNDTQAYPEYLITFTI